MFLLLLLRSLVFYRPLTMLREESLAGHHPIKLQEERRASIRYTYRYRLSGRFGSVWFGSVRFGSVRFGSVVP
jgi:hypothetical protein